MPQHCKAATIFAASCALAACGGGSGSADSNGGPSAPPTANYSALTAFADGGGVGRGVDEDGGQLVFIGPDITEAIAQLNDQSQDDLADIDIEDFPIVQVFDNDANLREGAISVEGFTFNVTIVEDAGGQAGIFLFEDPGFSNILMAGGTGVGSLPAGTFTYSGTLATGLRSANPQAEFGEFVLLADFNSGNFDFDGATLSDTVSGSGTIDSSSGTIASNNMEMNTSGVERSATMYGQFHGNQAESVSGVFHSNEPTPVYAGGFAGSR